MKLYFTLPIKGETRNYFLNVL